MSEHAKDTPPDVEVSSVRYMQKDGSKLGVLHVVVGGVHNIWPCQRSKIIYLIEDLMKALQKAEQA